MKSGWPQPPPPDNARFVQGLLHRVMAEIAIQTAWPAARRFTPPEGY